jgi:hypothetical protein
MVASFSDCRSCFCVVRSSSILFRSRSKSSAFSMARAAWRASASTVLRLSALKGADVSWLST